MTFKVGGWVPYWQYDAALKTVEANKDIFGDILLFDWVCKGNGTVLNEWYDPIPTTRLKATGLPYWATFTSGMNGKAAADMFDDPSKSQVLINNMISVAKNIGAVGLDLDFETINFGHTGNSSTRLKTNFPKFLSQLKKSAGTLKVSATIPARVSDTDPDWAVYDYAAIGSSVDIVRIMAYDNHDAGSQPGPVAPIAWVNLVTKYAKSKIPAAKLHIGVPAYGYDWPFSGNGKTVNAKDATNLATSKGTVVKYDAISGEGTFKYSGNTVWVATSTGIAKRASDSKLAGVAGIAIWSIGDEAPDTFAAIRKAINVTPTPPPAPKPKISLKMVQPGKTNAQVTIVQGALRRAGFYRGNSSGTFDAYTKNAYALYQRHLGYTGSGADGVPGIKSLTVLGNTYGFTVVA